MGNEPTFSRRDWLRTVTLYGLVGTTFGALATMLGDVWLAAGRFTTAHWRDLVAVTEVGGDGAFSFPAQRVALIRRGDRLAAMSLECSHLGCLVNQVDQGFFCPCHGSEFGPLGEVYSGPAPTSLPWMPLQIRRGKVWVHNGRKQTEPLWVQLTTAAPATGGGHHGST